MADNVKSTSAVKQTVSLPKEVFAVEVNNHELIKKVYQSYLANSRENYAVTKTRGLVRGGGKKPWRQKGTGRARFGSSRNPIWRGGGIVFGPTGTENYTKTVPVNQKRQAVRQALTLANQSKKVIVADFASKEGRVKDTTDFIKKHKLTRKVLIVVENKDEMIERATRNVQNVKVVQATYLNVFDIMNFDSIVISKAAVDAVKAWLNPSTSSQGKGGVNA